MDLAQTNGWEGAEGGLSPTEQEYDKARELYIPIYAFIDRMEQGKREAKQERFLDKLQNWDQGLARNEFHSLEELKDKIVGALQGHDLSPRYRRFLQNLTRLIREELNFRPTKEVHPPVFDSMLHTQSSGMNAGNQRLLGVIDGDLYDDDQVNRAITAWTGALRSRFQLAGLKSSNASVTLVIAVEHNPLRWKPKMMTKVTEFPESILRPWPL